MQGVRRNKIRETSKHKNVEPLLTPSPHSFLEIFCFVVYFFALKTCVGWSVFAEGFERF